MSKTARDLLAEYAPSIGSPTSFRTLGSGCADEIIAGLDAAGFVIVPKEPTKKMIELGLKNFRVAAPMEVAAAYVAMIYATAT